jgi:hypothetical protein
MRGLHERARRPELPTLRSPGGRVGHLRVGRERHGADRRLAEASPRRPVD